MMHKSKTCAPFRSIEPTSIPVKEMSSSPRHSHRRPSNHHIINPSLCQHVTSAPKRSPLPTPTALSIKQCRSRNQNSVLTAVSPAASWNGITASSIPAPATKPAKKSCHNTTRISPSLFGIRPNGPKTTGAPRSTDVTLISLVPSSSSSPNSKTSCRTRP